MSELANRLAAGLDKIITRAGTPFRIAYFTSTIGSVFDDDVTLTQSGNDLWTSGVVMSLDTSQGSYDSVLLEQGKLITDDKRLFIHGSLLLTGSELHVRILLGSAEVGVLPEYTLIDRHIRIEASNVPIYKKIFIRQIVGSALLGE